jgi:hypothetical protein
MADWYSISSDERDERVDNPCAMELWELDDLEDDDDDT